jgi:hypothetical protein
MSSVHVIRRSWVLALGFVAALSTNGCVAGAGRAFDMTHAPDIRPGVDEAAVQGWFGEPLSKMDSGGGHCSKRWVYYSAPSQVLFVDFGPDGRVCRQ